MIENYKDFLLESRIIQMINEGELRGSGAFIEKLGIMSKKNKIAEILHLLFEENEFFSTNLSQNWIDITPADDTISFLSDVKADKIDYHLDKFDVKGRTTVKIGRFLNAFLNNTHVKQIIKDEFNDIKFTDKDIEEFVNLYKSINLDANKKFKIVKGENIAMYYNEDTYASESGQLGNSCMRHVDPGYFDIYVHNEKVCKLLIYLNADGKLLGRALVWKLHNPICEAQYFMDRIYTANDSDIIKFKNYADEKGWMIKNRNTSDSEEGLMFRYKGKPVFGRIYVKLDDADFDEYPFVDTLSFLNKDDKLVSNVGFEDGNVLWSTDGYADQCDSCEGKGRDVCHDCDDERTVPCEECDGDGHKECEGCNGVGSTGKGKDKTKCEECDGEGYEECEECKGEGEVECENCKDSNACEECVGLEDELRARLKADRNLNILWKDYKPLV